MAKFFLAPDSTQSCQMCAEDIYIGQMILAEDEQLHAPICQACVLTILESTKEEPKRIGPTGWSDQDVLERLILGTLVEFPRGASAEALAKTLNVSLNVTISATESLIDSGMTHWVNVADLTSNGPEWRLQLKKGGGR